MASTTSCVCHIATHEGHGSAFCHTIGTGTDGDGRRLVWRARKGILPQNRGAWKAPSFATPSRPFSDGRGGFTFRGAQVSNLIHSSNALLFFLPCNPLPMAPLSLQPLSHFVLAVSRASLLHPTWAVNGASERVRVRAAHTANAWARGACVL